MDMCLKGLSSAFEYMKQGHPIFNEPTYTKKVMDIISSSETPGFLQVNFLKILYHMVLKS